MSRYVGDEHPRLTRLSTNEWKKVVKSVEADVERVAMELLDTYARRKISHGFAFLPFPGEETAFREAFPYTYTPDQWQSIGEVLADMAETEPMDRLLSGDVGFGKTEVAMNAVDRAFLNGKQTAFISPLVVLALEHYESLRERLMPFGVRIGILTRLSSAREAALTLKSLASGEIHCVIGTHRLLGETVVFKNLGLLVLDEEHKFGVMDKERINTMKTGLDILSLSATPIPEDVRNHNPSPSEKGGSDTRSPIR